MTRDSTMRALVYHGPGDKRLDEVPRPNLVADTDVIVRVTKTTVCGTDLHILHGDVPSVAVGRILGHEGIGVIDAAGTAVNRFRTGDRVVISCITACGRCENCWRSMPSHCERGGWLLGNTIDGTQAEYVRIPFADTSLHLIPPGADEDAMVLLSDILPTGYECGVLSGFVKPGDTVAIVGAGPVGLAALLTAKFHAKADIYVIDVDDFRLDVARQLGATAAINSADGRAVERIMALTGGVGVDVAIEAVGKDETFNLCQEIVGVGGHIANIGVHGASVTLHLEDLWSKDVTISTRLVDGVTTPMLLKSVVAGKLEPKPLITHHFSLDQAVRAYDTFAHAVRDHALKIIVTNP